MYWKTAQKQRLLRETKLNYVLQKGFDYLHYPSWLKTKIQKLRPIRDFFVQIVQIKGFYKLIKKQIYKLDTQNTPLEKSYSNIRATKLSTVETPNFCC